MSNKKVETEAEFNKWAVPLVQDLAKHTVKVLEAQDTERKAYLYSCFIAHMTGAVVFNALNIKPKEEIKDPEEAFEFTASNFKRIKLYLTEAFASGFSGAMKAFSKREVEYICTLRTVEEPKSKKGS